MHSSCRWLAAWFIAISLTAITDRVFAQASEDERAGEAPVPPPPDPLLPGAPFPGAPFPGAPLPDVPLPLPLLSAPPLGTSLPRPSPRDAADPEVATEQNDLLEQDVPVQEGVVEHVTLYRDQALVTRRIDIPAGNGVQEIRVGRLPEQVVSDSVFAEGDGDTEVRSVRVTRRASSASDRQEVKDLQEQLTELNRLRQATEQKLEVIDKGLQDIERLTEFSVRTGSNDLQRGVLDSTALTELVTYAGERREKLSESRFALRQELDEIGKKIQSVTNEHRLLIASPREAHYEARVSVRTAEGEAGQVLLSYLVGGCGWSPSYTVRARWGEPEVTLRYSALVRQMSGEAWPDVRLTLSTASPQVSASGPLLIPFRVLTKPVTGGGGSDFFGDDLFAEPPPAQAVQRQAAAPPSELKQAAKGLRQLQQKAETDLGASVTERDGERRRDLVLNALAAQMQGLEMRADSKDVHSLSIDSEAEVDSQTYALEQSVSLDSRREHQLVQITEAVLDAELYHVAMPLLSSFAYRQAELTNRLQIGLLGGPATVYLDDRFVGKMPLPTTASGQRLTVGLGADQQVRTRRELQNKRDEIQGGNRRLHFDYRLVIANFKSDPVEVRLMDRIPLPENPQAVSTNLEELVKPLSVDPLYLRIERPRGILRWDVTVPGGSFGGDAFDVEYKYSLEFDRSKELVTMDAQTRPAFDAEGGTIFSDDHMMLDRSGRGGGMGGGMGFEGGTGDGSR
jgi:hypothetical protein